MALNSLIPWKKKRGNIRLRQEHDDMVGSFHRDMNNLLDRFFDGFDIEPFAGFGTVAGEFMPRVDVNENGKEIKIAAELPGMNEDDIDVTLSKDSLTIRGEKKEETEDKGKDYYRMERKYGSFHRVIPLSAEVDESKADAKFKKGVLSIRLPKTAEARDGRKKIEVKSA